MTTKWTTYVRILCIAALLHALVFFVMFLFIHSAGPIAGTLLRIGSLVLVPPLILGYLNIDLSPIPFHVLVFLLESLYVYGVWHLFFGRSRQLTKTLQQ